MPLNKLDSGEGLRLHIGGVTPHPDFKIVNVNDGEHVDFCCDAQNLSIFENDSVDAIYASHVLEHFHYLLDLELGSVLDEWRRVLKTGGLLMVSVPDLDVLCNLFLGLEDLNERYHVMRMMFGGQTDKYDCHQVGFNEPILASHLLEHGFRNVERVASFGIFRDTSELEKFGRKISLNMVAIK